MKFDRIAIGAAAFYLAVTILCGVFMDVTFVKPAYTDPVSTPTTKPKEAYEAEAYHRGYEDAMRVAKQKQAASIERKPGRRYAKGKVVSKWYHEDGDFTSMEIITEDGNIWMVDDFVAGLDTPCIVEFATNGTADVVDDSITAVYTCNEFVG